MIYKVEKFGRKNKVGIPESSISNKLIWYSRDELKQESDRVLHISNLGKRLDGHSFQVALALSPVTRNDLKIEELECIEVVKASYKDTRPVDRKCNYVAVTTHENNKRWEFSVIKGLTYLFNGGDSLAKQRINNALRNAIKPQIDAFKQKNLYSHCQQYGDGMWHVDHIYPFSEIVKDFLWLYKVEIESIETFTDLSNGWDTIKNDILLRQWQRFHYENARLQFLTPEDNSRKSNKVA